MSKNITENGQDDGVNTLSLAPKCEDYVRIGIGEIFDAKLFADVPEKHININIV